MADTFRTQSGSTNQSGVTEDLKGDARDLKDTAVKQGEAKVAQGKDQASRTARSASSAMQTAADELQNDDQAPAWLASAFSSVAREVDGLASRLQDKSPREIGNEARRFARHNPSAFLAASAAAGFAAARFLRAGAEYHEDYDVGQGGSGNSGATYGSQGTYDRSSGLAGSTGTPSTTGTSSAVGMSSTTGTSTTSTGYGERDTGFQTNTASTRPMGDL